ncbi:MAG TPA: DUF1579 family protein [Thermoanaerobaculia bacterium]|jgi:hypothetical protein|nr:DUF1579 family protein [Thermoanaerobaculia bacterium]
MLKLPYLFVLAALVVASAFAQPKPSPRLADLQSFAGTWRCNGKAFASAWGPEHATRATIHVVWALRGFWLAIDYTEYKTLHNPHPAQGTVLWGYDEGTQKLTGYAVDNGGGHSMVESTGWDGATIVWSGPMHVAGMTIPSRNTFVRKSPREIKHTTEAEIEGKWQTFDEETCRKK